jgi:hypothetical protein
MTSTPPPAAEAPPAATAAPAATIFDDPLDDPELYPTFHELLDALQDRGTQVTKGKSAGEMRYNDLTRAVSNTQKTLLSKYKHFGIPKNPTECKRQIASHCIRIRKEQDVVNLPGQFHKYANTEGRVFIISTDVNNGGYRIVLAALLAFWGSRVKESHEQRNANDGLRLAAILLDTKHRSTVRQIMTNLKQDRKQQDQATCPIHAFYSVVSQDFTSPLYVAKSPALAEKIVGHEEMDPNDVSTHIFLCSHYNTFSKLVSLCTTRWIEFHCLEGMQSGWSGRGQVISVPNCDLS